MNSRRLAKDMSPILQLKSAAKQFEAFSIGPLDLELFPGEVHVLVGENGVGKSTLLKLIAGWFPPDSGDMYFDGFHTWYDSIFEAQKAGIVYISQDVQCFENLSVAENIFFSQLPTMKGTKTVFNPNLLNSLCHKAFRELDIDIAPETLMGKLGFTQKQLIAAVRAYIMPAKVIMFDEPSSAMNDPEREILFRIVHRLKERGVGMLYISHRMEEIHHVGDRISVLHSGRIAESAECDTVDRSRLIRMMTGEVHKERFPRFPSKRGAVVLEVSHLSRPPVLQDVSFTLRQGEILGITGLMGSGRTLLANCLFGNASYSQGTVRVKGQEVRIQHPEDAIRAGISLIPEDRLENGIFPRHDLIRNMTSASLQRFLNRLVLNHQYMSELSHEYVQEMHIQQGHSPDVMETYSGGNQQKVMLSRWLMKCSPIYIMDEPTRSIDASSRVDIYNMMNDLIGKNASVILISSDIEEILGMSDRILILSGGRISAELPREKASKEQILEYATNEQ